VVKRSANVNVDRNIRIVAISGSLRRASFCTGLIQRLAAEAGPSMQIIFHDISDIPLYNEDVEKESKPLGVIRLSRAVAESDGVLIVTPEYNHGIPGVLKNALDWVSQPFRQSAFLHKPVSLISTSLAFTGGVRAQYQLRETLHSMLAIVVPGPEVVVGGVHTKFDGETFIDRKVFGLILRTLGLLRNEILAGEFRAQLATGQDRKLNDHRACTQALAET
jgi:chromate reductase